MLLIGKCNTCGITIRLDIGEKSREEVIAAMAKRTGFQCPGHHVEIGSAYPKHWPLDEWELAEGQAETDEEFELRLRAEFLEVRDTAGMAGLITSFACGMPMTNDGRNWQFVTSPGSKRWYVTNSPER